MLCEENKGRLRILSMAKSPDMSGHQRLYLTTLREKCLSWKYKACLINPKEMEEDKARQSERKRGYNLLFTY